MHKVCRLSDLTEKKPYTIRLEGKEVGVIRVKDKIYAYENMCPHYGGPVCLGGVFGRVELELDEDKRVVREYVSDDVFHLVCPWHGYEFDLESGECVFDSKLKLNRFPVTIKDDDVYVQLDQLEEAKR